MNARNLVITMTLGGLWHGAAMHYLLWGLFHGLMLVAHKEFSTLRKSVAVLSAALDTGVGKAFSMLLTFHAVCIGWVLFRAEDIASCGQILEKLFFIDTLKTHASPLAMNLPAINYPLIYPTIYFVLPILAIAHIVMGKIDKTDWVEKSPKLVKAAWCVAMILLIVVFSPDKSPRFIYFQF
jgi:hypothetical protein